MNSKLKIGFTFDAKADYVLNGSDPHDKYAEFDSEKTISEIEDALRMQGDDVVRIGNVKRFIERIQEGESWDIIFNIAEGIKGRNREAQVPVVCEIYDLPYVGSDGLTMSVTLDKAMAKTIVAQNGIRTPRFLEIGKIEDLKKFDLKFPVIIKPIQEGTSKGLTKDSIVKDTTNLNKMVSWVIEKYSQPAIAEEFITGQEFTVALIGNNAPHALEPVQISILGKVDLEEEFYTHERVENNEIEYICPSNAPKDLLDKIKKMACDSYNVLGVKDFGRIDIRVGHDNEPYFLECNPLPNLGLIDVFPLVANAENMTYKQIVNKILYVGVERNNIKAREKENSLNR